MADPYQPPVVAPEPTPSAAPPTDAGLEPQPQTAGAPPPEPGAPQAPGGAPSPEPPAAPQAAPQIDPEYVRALEQRAQEAEWERQQAEAQRQRDEQAAEERRVKAQLAQRLVQAKTQAEEWIDQGVDPKQAAAFVARVAAENQVFLDRQQEALAAKYEGRIKEVEQAAYGPQFARDWARHYRLPEQYHEQLAEVARRDPDAVPNQAYAFALIEHERAKDRARIAELERQLAVGRMGANHAFTPPPAAGAAPAGQLDPTSDEYLFALTGGRIPQAIKRI